MKKFLLILAILLFSINAWAVEGMVVDDKGFFVSDNSRLKTLTLTCTTHTDGTFSQQLSDSAFDYVQGWLLMEVRITNLTTQTDPTVNSDVTFVITAAGKDLLHGAGTDMLDNDAVNIFKPVDADAEKSFIFMVDQFFIEVTNNSVSTAIFTIVLTLYPTE